MRSSCNSVFFLTNQRAPSRLRASSRNGPPPTPAAGDLDMHKWGRYLPMFRLNVDQVPLPFVNDMDYTYDMKGAKRVSINQLGPSLSKRQCTAQVCFRPVAPPPPPSTADDAAKARYKEHSLAQPLPCLVFRGTGKQISQLEQDAYPDELVVLCLATQGVGGPAYRSGLGG